MRKKFTMLLAALFLVMGTAWAENVLFNSTTALPGTLENSQYTWKSSEMTAPDGFTTLRLTFMKTTNDAKDPGGHPHVNIAEFYLYDNTGTPVSLTADKFSSNATETNEGKSGLHRLCDGTYNKLDADGVNDWYWHSLWSSNAGAYHYLEINVADIPNLSTFAVGYVTRQENGSPTELLVTTGSSTEDVAAQCPNVTVTYNHLLGGVSKKTESRDAVVGASYPAPSLPWGVKVVTDLSGTVTEGGTKDIEVAYNGELPFTPSASFETAHWYYLKFTKDARYIRYNETDTYIPTDLDEIYPNVDPEAYAWAFVGDPYTGEYKLMNRKAGSTKVLSSTRNVYDGSTGANTFPLMKEESGINETTDNKTWIVTKSTSIAGVNGMFIGLKTSNDETKYMNSRSSKLAFWTGGEGDGSTFQTEEFSYAPAFVVAKEEALNSLNALAAIASDKTEAAKTAIEALNPTTSDEALAAFSTLNEQMNSVVSGEYFTLQNKNNTSIYLTTDGTNASATTTADIKAYWTLKNKNGLFYLYNKYNNAYLQAIPNANETKTTITDKENLAAAYKAVLPVNDANNVWALTSFIGAGNGDQRFLHKAGDNRIVRWTATAEASQWTITEVDYAAAFSALVEAQLGGKVFNDNPALGEYPTSAKEAFDALKTAYLTNPTDENERALVNGIAELEKAKNRPVFFIESMKDYALNQGIYEINASNLKFKAKNEFDKTMWWSFDMTSTEVSCTDRVVVRNVGSGNLFWGAEFVSVIETDPAVEGDGVFMFKTNGTGNPVHAQKDNSAIVRWSSADANTVGGASTWKFVHIGNTYELSKLTDEKIAALQALKTAVDEKSYLTWLNPGTGVGQYDITTEEYNDIVRPIYEASALVQADLTEKAGYEVSEIEAFTTAVNAAQFPANKLGSPTVGKYYRIKGANTGAENYLTGNVTVNGNHIALQADKNNATIFRYVNNKLLAVESNLYVAMTSSFYTFQILEKNAPSITFAASSRKAGAYTINSGRYFHYNSNNTEGTFLDRCSTDPADHTAHDWYLEEVAESEVPANTNLLTDINNLSGEASYRIYGDRGFIYVADDGNMKGTNSANVAYNPNNNKHHFAIVTIGENKYLYNVGAKKFVMKSGNSVTLTDWPEQAITIEGKTNADSNVGYDWVIKFGDNRMNLSDSGTYGVYTNYNTEDGGNVWAIYKVGSFAPAEAQSMKKVIVNYTIDGVAATETVGVAAGSTLNFSYEFATVTSCKVGEEAQEITDGACSVTIQDNVTISVAMTSDTRLFRLKNTVSSKYMTIVTQEAAEGVQIKDKADDPVKQAFRIVLANWQGKYNIKSTENYFMASSTGGWDYGAYQTTTNEAGRAHELESLGEGKYGLKTLNGYAGPNSGATADGSPLYSNHGAGNSGRMWELEELTKSSITYIYKWNDQTIESEVHENVYEGLAAPATAVTLPFGFSYDPASLPTIKGAGDQNVEIPCTLSLPFEYYDAFDNVEKWYYLRMHAESQNFLYYEEGATSLDATKTEVDAADKDAYTWAFVGDPINGFSVVNKKAGKTFVLSSAVEPTADKEYPKMALVDTITTGNKVWDLYTSTSTDVENGFFMAYDGTTKRLNKQDGKVCYWLGGADNGSTFIVQERDLSGAVELQEYINEVTLLLEALGDGTATAVGYVTAESLADVNSAMAVAETAIQNKENINEAEAALQNAVKNLKTIQPTVGVYYTIQNSYSNVYMNVAGNTGLKTTDAAGLGEVFQFVPAADDKFYMYNVERGTFLSTAKGHGGGQNQAGAVEQTSAVAVTIANLGAENHVSIVPEGGTTMHHDANLSTVVGWDGGLNTRSSWKIVEVASLTGLTREVTIGSTGYSTLYLNYATIVPEIEGEENGVFVASEIASNYIELEPVAAGEVLPANTGVIIKAAAGTYNFNYTSEEGSVTSAFMGSSYNKYITPEDGTTCYVLAKPTVEEGEEEKPVGLYKASLNKNENTAFLNNANKIYLPVPVAEPQAAQALAFRFRGKEQGTTGIEGSELEAQGTQVIYDLAGRRIEKIVEKGIYIVNGRKVIVK